MAGTNSMHNLTTLIKRLEAATSRLEDIALTTYEPGAPSTLPSAVAAPVPNGTAAATGPAASAAAAPEPLPESIEEFDKLISGPVQKYLTLSKEADPLLAKQAELVVECFNAERKFLMVTTKAKKPDITSQTYMAVLTDLQKFLGAVSDVRESNRASKTFNHLSTVSEGVTALAWVTIEPKPAAYVTENLSGAQYYGNRILREKDQKQVEWVQSYYQILQDLTKYVQEYYKQGVTWNNKDGIDAGEVLRQLDSGAPPAPPAPTAGGPPPPPPPPPPPVVDGLLAPGQEKSAAGKGDMSQVFADLNKGESVTSGLRKVDKSEMTHKNPSLRTTSVVPTRSDSTNSTSSRGKSPAPGTKPKPESMKLKKPPRKELDGLKWIIENYENEQIVLDTVERNHSILISRCKNTTIQVKGKCNAVSVDSSTKLSLIIDSLVSSLDVIKSPSFAVQVLDTLPTILLDQVDGGTVYLAKSSLGVEIFTSKCTAININVPGAGEDDDYQEKPVPEQFKTTIKGGALVSEIVEHAG